jgi:hypothetical protein
MTVRVPLEITYNISAEDIQEAVDSEDEFFKEHPDAQLIIGRSVNNRAETGPMQFGDDWRGVFIRGDNALMGYLPMLYRLKQKSNLDMLSLAELDGLISLIESSNHHSDNTDVQFMKDFKDCIKTK